MTNHISPKSPTPPNETKSKPEKVAPTVNQPAGEPQKQGEAAPKAT